MRGEEEEEEVWRDMPVVSCTAVRGGTLRRESLREGEGGGGEGKGEGEYEGGGDDENA